MRLIGYVRVSRVAGREGDSFISPSVQRERCQALALAHSHTIVDWREDLDQPGSRYDRVGFQEAIAAVEHGEADGVIVASLDRFARSVPDAAVALRRLETVGGTLISVRDSLDTSTPVGRFARTMMLGLAELELDRIRENWLVARDRAIGRGVHISRVPPVGYQRGSDGRLEVDAATAPAVREVFRRRGAGASWQELCRLLDRRLPRDGSWPVQTVTSIVANRVYLGEARHGPISNPNAHRPLVRRSTWEQAQQVSRLRLPRGEGAMLAGIARCAGCSHLLVHQSDGARGYRNYGCRKRHRAGVCPRPARISVRRLDSHVEEFFLEWAARQQLAFAGEPAGDVLADAVDRVAQTEAELAAYRDANLVTVIGRDAYVAGLDERARSVDAARAEAAEARRRQRPGRLALPAIVEEWPRLAVQERRQIIAASLDAVFVRQAHLRGQGSTVGDRVVVLLRGEHVDQLPGRGLAELRPFLFADESPDEIRPAAAADREERPAG